MSNNSDSIKNKGKLIDIKLRDTMGIRDVLRASHATLNNVIIDSTSGTTTTTSTTLPREILEQQQEERDLSATRLAIEKNAQLNSIKDKLPEIFGTLLDKKNDSLVYRDGTTYHFFSCQFYGAAVGHNIDITFNNTWDQLKDSTDFQELRKELNILIERLPKSVTDIEQYQDIGHVVTASEELNKANGPGMLKCLKKAGNWVLTQAKAIDLPLIIRLLELLKDA